MGRDGTVRSRVSAYLVEHVGEICHADTIAEETGLRRAQVQQSVNSMITSGVAIKIEIPGNAWLFVGTQDEAETEAPTMRPSATRWHKGGRVMDPPQPAAPVVELAEPVRPAPVQVVAPVVLRDTRYEEVTTDPHGEFVILRDTEGRLWQARRLA